MLEAIIIVVGLIAFEFISSVDNAIVNAHVLTTVPEKFRKFFLTWGLLVAVVMVRGLLPFIIVLIANQGGTLAETWHLVWSDPVHMEEALVHAKPLLLVGGGIYLVFIFLSWLFLEEKRYAFLVEHFLHRQSVWFYAIASVLTTVVVYKAVQINPAMALAASIGTSAFFLTDGFRKNAEEQEKKITSNGNMSAIGKLLYLEVLDASFSIDGVVGAFAFTTSVPLILIGNGIGAFVVREFTIRGTGLIQRYAYLKNGAMYSIGMLGAVMLFESFGAHFPFWIAPLNTILVIAFFIFLSYREIKLAQRKAGE